MNSSFTLITTEELKALCFARLAAVESDKALAASNAIEAARSVWWRDKLGLPKLTREEAYKRLERKLKEEMFGGPIGSIQVHYAWGKQDPERLLNLCHASCNGEVLLSCNDANLVAQWKRHANNA